MTPLPIERASINEKRGGRNLAEESRRQSTRGYSVMPLESKRILLVSAWVPGSFHGRFDTEQLRGHRTLKGAVILLNPDNVPIHICIYIRDIPYPRGWD